MIKYHQIMTSCVLLQRIVLPEFWVSNLYVPVADFERLVSAEELARWIGHDDISDVCERVQAAPGVTSVRMGDSDVPPSMMPEGTMITKYYVNVTHSC